MNCIHCGQPLNPGARFCTSCGKDQNDRTMPKPPESSNQSQAKVQVPAPGVQQIPAPVTRSGGISAKALIIIIASVFLLVAIAGAAAWLYFFPPGVYIKDNFGKAHREIESQIKSLGSEAVIGDNKLEIRPPNKLFYMLMYETPASPNATIESTITWTEGEKDLLFGVVCCAASEENFTAFLVGGKGEYLLQNYANGQWFALTSFLKLPKAIQIEKNVPYNVRIVTEGDVISVFFENQLLLKMTDAIDHGGRFGFYAQGGSSGTTKIVFEKFRAKKNSLFQPD
jgi:hypothetical protein